jgi:hypothetical protein
MWHDMIDLAEFDTTLIEGPYEHIALAANLTIISNPLRSCNFPPNLLAS